jgi:hypothetical protein
MLFPLQGRFPSGEIFPRTTSGRGVLCKENASARQMQQTKYQKRSEQMMLENEAKMALIKFKFFTMCQCPKTSWGEIKTSLGSFFKIFKHG